MRAKLILRLCLFTSIYLTATDCRQLPNKSPTMFQLKHQQPADRKPFFYKSSDFEAQKTTNQDFCIEFILRPEDHYGVLPWWYSYCEDLRKKHPEGMPGYVDMKVIEKYLFAEMELYKQRLNGKNVEMSELENDLVEINKAKAAKPAYF